MSERYANCRTCGGRGFNKLRERDGATGEATYTTMPCLTCDETGQSGDARDYMEMEGREEHEREAQELAMRGGR